MSKNLFEIDPLKLFNSGELDRLRFVNNRGLIQRLSEPQTG